MSWVDVLGYAAAAAVLATFCMSTMIPLRILALGSNVLFAVYGYFEHLYPVLILQAVLIPVSGSLFFNSLSIVCWRTTGVFWKAVRGEVHIEPAGQVDR